MCKTAMQKRQGQKISTATVSVVVPVFNTEESYFREAVESLLSQTYCDFELLLVDNGSDSYIAEIVREFADERIRYHRLKTNCGSAYARNYGIERAVGKYIAFMDSDDISLSERLEKQVSFLEEHPEVGCLGANVQVIGETESGDNFNELRSHHEIEAYLAFGGCAICQSSLVVRRNLLLEHGIRYREEWVPAEDYGICVDMMGKTRFRILPDTLVHYRKYRGSTSDLYQQEQQEKGKVIRRFALSLYCGDVCTNMPLLSRFACGDHMSRQDLCELPQLLESLLVALQKKGYAPADFRRLLIKRMKKNIYHTRTLRGQLDLVFSPVNKFFKLPFTWRLMCLITRGVFK